MEEFLQIRKTKLYEGYEKEYRFLQISDIHMATVDNKSSQIDIEENNRVHKQWGTLKAEFAKKAGELCDERYDLEPNILLESLIDYALDFEMDAIIFSGDIMDRVSETNIRYIKNLIKEIPLRIIYCPGNHEHMNENGEYINQYDRLKDIIKNPDFAVYPLDDFDIVAIDNGRKVITDNQLAAFEEKLKEDRKIMLVLHAPLNLGEFGEELSGKISPYFLQGVSGDCENAFKFNKLVCENDDKIIAVLAGHIHFFAEGKITDKLTQYTTSSGLIGAGREIVIK